MVYNVLKLAFEIVAAIGVLFVAFGFFLSRRNSQFAVAQKCTTEFRAIIRRFQRGQSNAVNRKDLLGLFNEQLFYIENLYISKEIRLEWIKSMYCYLNKIKIVEEINFNDTDFGAFEKVRIFKHYYENMGNKKLFIIEGKKDEELDLELNRIANFLFSNHYEKNFFQRIRCYCRG